MIAIQASLQRVAKTLNSPQNWKGNKMPDRVWLYRTNLCTHVCTHLCKYLNSYFIPPFLPVSLQVVVKYRHLQYRNIL